MIFMQKIQLLVKTITIDTQNLQSKKKKKTGIMAK